MSFRKQNKCKISEDLKNLMHSVECIMKDDSIWVRIQNLIGSELRLKMRFTYVSNARY